MPILFSLKPLVHAFDKSTLKVHSIKQLLVQYIVTFWLLSGQESCRYFGCFQGKNRVGTCIFTPTTNLYLSFPVQKHKILIHPFVFRQSCHTVCKSISFIYFTSITQKARWTYIRVLEGADVGVKWSNVAEETGEPGENHQTWTGDHYPATCLDPDSNTERRGDKRYAIQAPCM